MSEASQGPGWWQASDGKWYPPKPTQVQPDTVGPTDITAPPEPGGGVHGVVPDPVQSAQTSAVTAPAAPPPHQAQQVGYPTHYAQQPPAPPTGGSQPVPPQGNRDPAKVFASVSGVLIVVLLAVIGYLFTREGDTQATDETTPTTLTSDSTEPPVTDPPATDPPDTNPTTTTPPTTSGELTPRQLAAAEVAADLLEYSSYSRSGLIRMLTSDGEFTREDAKIGVDSLDVDWNEQALITAQRLIDHQAFSYARLGEYLVSSLGAGFTPDQATYAADNVTADWNVEATEAAEFALTLEDSTCKGVVEYLTEDALFTPEQAQHGAEQAEAC